MDGQSFLHGNALWDARRCPHREAARHHMPLCGVSWVNFWGVVNAPDGHTRTHFPAHITTSGLVFNSSLEKVLLLYHRKHQDWVYPGGHADGDRHWLRSALRELREETGLLEVSLLAPPWAPSEPCGAWCWPHMVQAIAVPGCDGMAGHTHYDAVYAWVADESAPITTDDRESAGAIWHPVDQVQGLTRQVVDKVHRGLSLV